jgi:hypothetical protein
MYEIVHHIKHHLSWVAAYGLSIALLCMPALWNGFPLIFDDVGGYLERWPTGSLGLGRSAVYGLLLWITRWVAFGPVVWIQALVTVFVVDCARRSFWPGQSPWALLGIVTALGLTSGVAFFVCKLIPDAWAAPGILAFHLLAWHSETLTKLERVGLAIIIAFAGASHMAIFGVLAGLSILNGVAWLARRRLRLAPTGIAAAAIATWSGMVLLLAVNLVVAERFAFTPGGAILLLGGLIEDGMAGEVLADECPRIDWQLCGFRNELPAYSEAFIWDPNSPLQKIGGPNDPRAMREITSIVVRSLLTHKVEHIERAAALTIEQFFDIATNDCMEPVTSWHTRWTFARYAPWLLPYYDAARQQSEVINLSLWSDWIAVPVNMGASLGLPALAVLAWRRKRRREAVLLVMLCMALAANALICGTVASPNDRYQARLVWLATLALGLTGPTLSLRTAVAKS